MHRLVPGIAFFVLLAAWGSASMAVTLEEGTYVPGRLLVKFQPGTDAAAKAALHGQFRGQRIQTFRLDPDLELVLFPEGTDLGALIDRYQAQPDARYAEPDFIYRTQGIPNDTRFGDLWGMHNTGQRGGLADFDIDAPEAWDLNTSGAGIVIGSIDTGVNPNHEDLAANIWAQEFDHRRGEPAEEHGDEARLHLRDLGLAEARGHLVLQGRREAARCQG